MKKIIIIMMILPLTVNINAQKKLDKVELQTENDTLSYSFGILIADNLSKQNIKDLNPLAIAKAFHDFYQNKSLVTVDESNKITKEYFEKKSASEFEKVIEEGKKFLAENAKKKGVKTLESGLQYKVLKEGTGKSPTTSDQVEVHYEGTLIDGTKFDSSYDRGETIVFGVTQVIKGWTEALQLMKEGSVWMIYIPDNLAYGKRGAGELIKPHSTLIFKVELIKVITE